MSTSALAEAAVAARPRRIGRLARMSLAVEIGVAYALVRWELRRHDLPRVVTTLRAARRPRRRLPLPDATLHGRRLGSAVARALEATPFDSRCLARSLVLLRLLARRGANAALVIAARPNEGMGLSAHAYIERDGEALLPPADVDHVVLVTL